MTDELATDGDIIERYIVVKANGVTRVVSRPPKLAMDEFAFPLILHVPEGWGKLYKDQPITITLPDPGDAMAEVGGSFDGVT